jgi:ribosomal protein S18 acetylase RimI-like enzyme
VRSNLEVDAHRFARYPGGWQTASLDEDAVGLTQPLLIVNDDGRDRSVGTIGLIGVVAAYRGKEYEIDLVVSATASLIMAGVSGIRCEVDEENRALLAALKRVGYMPLV